MTTDQKIKVLSSLAVMATSEPGTMAGASYRKTYNGLLADIIDEHDKEPEIDLGLAVNRLTTALDNDPELYQAYKSNIAISFWQAYEAFRDENLGKDFVMHESEKTSMHKVCNRGAENFLKLFIQSTNPPKS